MRKYYENRTVVFSLIFLLIISCNVVYGGCPDFPSIWASKLKSKGYTIDTTEDIKKALDDKSYLVRYIALQLLASQVADEAIPELREGLKDESVEVRWRAAELLCSFGDKSGLKQMQKDFQEFLPRNGSPVPDDPGIVEDQGRYNRWQRNRGYRIHKGLEVAKVLASYGDLRGYVVSKETLNSPSAGYRKLAAEVMAEIGRADKSILAKEKKEPVRIISEAAKNEKKNTVLRKIIMLAENKLKRDDAIIVLNSIKNSPNAAEDMKRRAIISLKRLKAE